jgi:hypothetical protein
MGRQIAKPPGSATGLQDKLQSQEQKKGGTNGKLSVPGGQ